jgi:hypothetical protein
VDLPESILRTQSFVKEAPEFDESMICNELNVLYVRKTIRAWHRNIRQYDIGNSLYSSFRGLRIKGQKAGESVDMVPIIRLISVRTVRIGHIVPETIEKWIFIELRMLTDIFPIELVLSVFTALPLNSKDCAASLSVQVDNPSLLVKVKSAKNVGKRSNRIVARIVPCNGRPNRTRVS